MDVKPGIYSTESWMMFAAKLLSAMVAFGVLNASQSASALASVGNVVLGIATVLSFISGAKAYLQARTDLKTDALQWLEIDRDKDGPEPPPPPAQAENIAWPRTPDHGDTAAAIPFPPVPSLNGQAKPPIAA